MATNVTLGGDGSLFVGEDKTLRLAVNDKDGNPIDISGWTIIFDVRVKDNSPDPAMLSINATITGVFNSVSVSNTQRAVVQLTDDDLNLFKGSNLSVGARQYRHSWKRMDDGVETVLSRGDFLPEKATAN